MSKNITKWFTGVFFLFVLCIGCANAGPVKKITGVATSYLVRYEAKKVASAAAKHAAENLLKNELKTGSYRELKQINKLAKKLGTLKNQELEAHHIPSDKFMKKYGIKRDDAIAINVEKVRHSLTTTYKGRNRAILNKNLSPRDELARDSKNIREIYRAEKDNLLNKRPNESFSDYKLRDKKYEKDLRKALKEVIEKNKTLNPTLFKK